MFMVRILFFLILFAGTLSISKGQSLPYQILLKGLYDASFPLIKPEQISNLSNYQVLDAREKVEYQVSHLENALWVGHDTFNLTAVEKLDKTKPVLIYCTVGARSEKIGKLLQQEGFSRVYNLYGGIVHWVNEGRPVFANGKPTLQVHTYSKPWGIWLTKGEKVY